MDEIFAEHKYLSCRKTHGVRTCNLISRAPRRCYFVASKPVISGVALQLIASLRREIQIAACEKSIFDSSILFEEIKNISRAPVNELRRDSQKKV
jgi:hypothetical protein